MGIVIDIFNWIESYKRWGGRYGRIVSIYWRNLGEVGKESGWIWLSFYIILMYEIVKE